MAKIKVSQATIDQIKKMGMDKALKSAASASPEMKEGLRRMYGEKRLAAAGGTKSMKQPRQESAKAPAMKQPRQETKASAKKTGAKQPRQANYNAPKKSTPKKENTTSNPFTALHNKLSPVGNKEQKFKSPLGEGLGTKKPVKGKPSIGEQISGVFTGKTKIGPKLTAQSVAATNAKRMGISVAEYNRRLNAKKK